MTHAEFLAAYRDGTVRVHIAPSQAARFMSARLMLPFVMLPVLGIGTAIALTYSVWLGLAIIGIGTLMPVLIKRSAPHFVLTQSLQDPKFYDAALESRVLEITRAEARHRPGA
jgi:hypothetical protein